MQNNELVTCRRVNYIQAAMVQAAISIQKTHGTPAAVSVLQAENLAREVIDRVLAAGARKRLSPYSALERAVLLPLGGAREALTPSASHV